MLDRERHVELRERRLERRTPAIRRTRRPRRPARPAYRLARARRSRSRGARRFRASPRPRESGSIRRATAPARRRPRTARARGERAPWAPLRDGASRKLLDGASRELREVPDGPLEGREGDTARLVRDRHGHVRRAPRALRGEPTLRRSDPRTRTRRRVRPTRLRARRAAARRRVGAGRRGPGAPCGRARPDTRRRAAAGLRSSRSTSTSPDSSSPIVWSSVSANPAVAADEPRPSSWSARNGASHREGALELRRDRSDRRRPPRCA